MKAASNTLQPTNSIPEEILDAFFGHYSPEEVKVTLWKIYRLAVIGKSQAISHLSEEDIALLFEQLIALVAATSAINQAGRATLFKPERGDRHD